MHNGAGETRSGTGSGRADFPSERAAPWFLSLEEIDNSPSRAFFARKYGNSIEKARVREQECRLTTCAFLQESGQKLRLPQLSIATAIVFYHRFYARESYEHYERFQAKEPRPYAAAPCRGALLALRVATTCLFLASKVEETPKKLRDVIIETYKVQHSTVQPPESDQELWRLKEQVLICERELLRVLGFDLSVEHAYRPLLAYVKSISGPRDLAQIAWNFINDSLRTTVCLQYAPRCLAAASAWMACQYLEAKQRPFHLPAHPPGTDGKWFDAFQVRESTVAAIVKQIHTMYDENKGGGGGVLLANSGAVERMRMQGISAKSEPGKPSTSTPASREPSRGGGGASSSSSSVKREEAKRERGCDAQTSRPADAPNEHVKQEEGEIEEGELDDPPPSKRPRDGAQS